MNAITFLVLLLVTLPILGLAVLGWLAMEDDAGDLCAMSNFNGLQFED